MADLSEDLQFQLVLSGTYWDKRPSFDVLIDDTIVLSDTISASPSRKGLADSFMDKDYELVTYQTHDFSYNLSPGEHTLGIRLKNKTSADTRHFVNEGHWLNDMLLNIEKISIDNVDLQHLLWTKSVYKLDAPFNGQTQLLNCTNLGFNGTYQIKFSIPFYIWLLECL
jgi:hypothetical protein